MTATRELTGVRRGVSRAENTDDAVEELFAQIFQPNASLAVVFCSPRHGTAALERALRERFAGIHLIGCTSAGEITPEGYLDGVVTGFSLSADEFVAVSRRIDNLESFSLMDGYSATQSLLWKLEKAAPAATAQNTFALLLIDGLSMSEERVVSAIGPALGDIPLCGGSAADDLLFKETLLFHDGGFHRRSAVLTLVHTRLPFRVFTTQHFVGTDRRVVVTGADSARRVVTELNGRPAAQEYARYLGIPARKLDIASMARGPLAVKVGGASYTRGVEMVNDDGSLTFACAIDQGVILNIAQGTDLVANLVDLFATLEDQIGKPRLIAAFDCAHRKLEVAEKGLWDPVSRLFAANGVIGFCSFGEQFNAMHINHSFTGVAFGAERQSLSSVLSSGPGSPWNSFALQPPPLPASDEGNEYPLGDAIEVDNANKMVRVLMERLERNIDLRGDTYSLFQNAIIMEDIIRKRTTELTILNKHLTRELARRREMEEALRIAKHQAEQANHSKSRFLAAISHDLQQPLNAARLFLGTIAENETSEENAMLVERIEESLKTADDLLGALLDISRLDAGAMPVERSTFPLDGLLTQLAAEYMPQAAACGIELRYVPTSRTVCTDRRLLQRVLRNFLSNAVRYTAEGTILLGCRHGGDGLWIEVWDTGVGIPEDKLSEIFQEFHQLRNLPAARGRGAGLGLAIVDRIARMLGLTVEVKSRLGKGSAFRILVPYGTTPGGEEPADDPRPKDDQGVLDGKVIIVVDDDPDILDAMGVLLATWGCTTVLGTDTAEVLEKLAVLERRPDLVMADYHLGDDLYGTAVIDTFQAAYGDDLKSILITSYYDAPIFDRVEGRPFRVMRKPVKPAQLRSMMTYLLSPPP